MKLTIFYPKQTFAGWFSLGGYAQALRRLGHEVTDCPLPGNQPHDIKTVLGGMPSIEQLSAMDAVISFYHEYTQPWLKALYGSAWLSLKVPVIARYDESMDRRDLGLPARMVELIGWAKYHSFPAAQDAKMFGGQWLPFGADTEMFRPLATTKEFDISFVGQMYGPRAQYAQMMAQQAVNGFALRCGQVGVMELSGMREPESTELLARTYCQIKVFFCLPPLSNLIVAKVFDIMACGTFVMIPRLPGSYAETQAIFEDFKHVVYYEHGYVRENAKQAQRWLEDDQGREEIARAGSKLVREKYTLDGMLDKLLEPVVPKVIL